MLAKSSVFNNVKTYKQMAQTRQERTPSCDNNFD